MVAWYGASLFVPNVSLFNPKAPDGHGGRVIKLFDERIGTPLNTSWASVPGNIVVTRDSDGLAQTVGVYP